MSAFKVRYEELDWEDASVPFGALFNGQKFSGIAFCEHGDRLYEEYAFKDGVLHGRNFLFDQFAQELVSESFYENGIPVNTHFKWYSDASLKHTRSYFDGLLVALKIENRQGNPLLHYDRETSKFTEWFTNGQKSSEKELESTNNLYRFKKEHYWSEDGTWLMTRTGQINYQFHTEYLLANSDTLSTEQEEDIFVLFSENVLSTDVESGVSFLKSHTKHSNPFFRYQVARLLSKTKAMSAIAVLEELLDDDLQPVTELTIGWDGTGRSRRTEHSISKMAQIAIENIKK